MSEEYKEYRPSKALIMTGFMVDDSDDEGRTSHFDEVATDLSYRLIRGEELYSEARLRMAARPDSRIVAYAPGAPTSLDFHCYLGEKSKPESKRDPLPDHLRDATVTGSRLVPPKSKRERPKDYAWHRLGFLLSRDYVKGGPTDSMLQWFKGEIPHFKFVGIPEQPKSPYKKICAKCEEVKSVDDFRFVKSRGSRASQCRACETAARHKRRGKVKTPGRMSQEDFRDVLHHHGAQIRDYVVAKSRRETSEPSWQIEIRREAWAALWESKPGQEYTYYAEIIKKAAWRARKRLSRQAQKQSRDEYLYLYSENADVIMRDNGSEQLAKFRHLGVKTPKPKGVDLARPGYNGGLVATGLDGARKTALMTIDEGRVHDEPDVIIKPFTILPPDVWEQRLAYYRKAINAQLWKDGFYTERFINRLSSSAFGALQRQWLEDHGYTNVGHLPLSALLWSIYAKTGLWLEYPPIAPIFSREHRRAPIERPVPVPTLPAVNGRLIPWHGEWARLIKP